MILVEIEKKKTQQNKHSFSAYLKLVNFVFTFVQSENFANFILWHFALVKRNDGSEPCYLLREIHEKKAIISLYKGNVQALKYSLAFEQNKPWADRHGLRVAWEQKRKFHQNYFSPVRFLVLFSFQEGVLSMYNLPSTSSCLGYLTNSSSFICRAAQCPASHPSLAAVATLMFLLEAHTVQGKPSLGIRGCPSSSWGCSPVGSTLGHCLNTAWAELLQAVILWCFRAPGRDGDTTGCVGCSLLRGWASPSW